GCVATAALAGCRWIGVDSGTGAEALLRRRFRRFGLAQAVLGLLLGWMLGSAYGALVGGAISLCGIYLAFGYLRLAARIRRFEQRRESARYSTLSRRCDTRPLMISRLP